ncbi:MAG: ABC transporter ATP-binding protein [Candidatus Zixiibacteriota bacterium]
MTGLIIKNLNKSFGGRAVLKHINLELAEGELLVLLGPSGCGKSTLLRIIAGLETADSGEIHISNSRIDLKEPKDRNVALVFQNYALYPHMTVEKNLSFPLRIARTPKEEINRKVNETAELLGLKDRLRDRPGRLSGGERQRVALGRAIIRDPAIFLLDEPLSNLDADLRGRMRREIVALQKRLKKTLIHVTHDQTEALSMADRIALMNNGEIVQVGTPRELYQTPVDLFTSRFIGYPTINIIKSKVINGAISPLNISLSEGLILTYPKEFQLGIRPEDIVLEKNGSFEGKVDACEYFGGQMLVKIDCQGIKLTSMASALTVAPGDHISFNILTKKLIFFETESSQRIVF